MTTTIPVMNPPQYNDFHVGRVVALRFPATEPVNHHVGSGPIRLMHICACDGCHFDVRLVPL
jgi:hypothetical protein